MAKWLIAEFFAGKDTTEADLLKSMANAKREGLPLGLASFEGETLTGTISLLKEDIGLPSELTPWIAGVYVDTPHRGKGIGKALVLEVLKEVKRLNFSAARIFSFQ